MVTATWKGTVLATSEETVVVEGNHYFPPDSVDQALLQDSTHTTVCPWKGTASYHDVVVDGEVNPNAAWVYHDPLPEASRIQGHLAFWRGVEVG